MSSALLTEQTFAKIIEQHGGQVFRVGGCVRDKFMGITPKDIDFCIVGMVKRNFKMIFPDAEEYGKSFPVFRLLIDGVRCELAFARTERKIGDGYKGFKVSSSPKVTIEEDLFRRDTTVNSIAIHCLTGEVIDPFHGREDIHNKILRATSLHFSDDPMRALRLAGQSARFGFQIEQGTIALASAVAHELAHEPNERVMIELTKVLAEAQMPARFFQVLAEAKLLSVTFQTLADLPIEDFNIVMQKLDAVAKVTKNPKLRFVVFGFILNKERLLQWNEQMTLPSDWLNGAIAFGNIKSLLENGNPDQVVTAIHRLRRGALSVEEFDMIAKGTMLHLPALAPLSAAISLSAKSVPEHLKGKEIGEWLKKTEVEIIKKLLE